MGESYDPDAEAHSLGVLVIESDVPLRPDETGLYNDELGVIVLRPEMGPIQRRSVLAHEIEHARAHDRPTGLTKARMEHLADVRAAARLIDDDMLADVMLQWPDCAARWALELQVSPHLLTVHLQVAGRMAGHLMRARE